MDQPTRQRRGLLMSSRHLGRRQIHYLPNVAGRRQGRDDVDLRDDAGKAVVGKSMTLTTISSTRTGSMS